MDRHRRKELVAGYKEKSVERGIVALRCTASGEVWVHGSRNLAGQENSIRFTMRQGVHPNPAVQAAFRAHAEEAFSYEVLERLKIDDDASAYFVNAELKERAAHWRTALGAKALVG